jgi:hypothetical protein
VDLWSLLGGAAVLAVLFFVLKQAFQFVLGKWLQTAWAWITKTPPPQTPRLTIELPKPVNPPGAISFGAFSPWWSFRVRFIVRDGEPVSIVELSVIEEGVGAWSLDELFRESRGRVVLPLRVAGADDVWIRARSPRSFAARPAHIGKVVLRVRDQTQGQDEHHTVVLTEGQPI